MSKWIPPYGFTCTVHHMDARIGGTFMMSFHNFSTGHGHSFGGEYRELVPGRLIRYTDTFDDPNLPGEMEVTVSLTKVSCGTEITIRQEGVPEVIPLEMCYLGWQESLAQLANLVEPNIPGSRRGCSRVVRVGGPASRLQPIRCRRGVGDGVAPCAGLQRPSAGTGERHAMWSTERIRGRAVLSQRLPAANATAWRRCRRATAGPGGGPRMTGLGRSGSRIVCPARPVLRALAREAHGRGRCGEGERRPTAQWK
jgi:uncharacterized protein YndB with AHSA1/START domain